MDSDELLAEQRSFYRARAPEYDEWWQRQGPYDQGAPAFYRTHTEANQHVGPLQFRRANGDPERLEAAG